MYLPWFMIESRRIETDRITQLSAEIDTGQNHGNIYLYQLVKDEDRINVGTLVNWRMIIPDTYQACEFSA